MRINRKDENQLPKVLNVVAYIRKSSSDSEDKAHKQVNSLNYQKKYVKNIIKKHNLKLIGTIYEDDFTGYEAFVRKDFNKMLDVIEEEKGNIHGIVCTEISRLGRNFGDGGLILWNLQCGNIRRIFTHDKIFTDSSADQLMVAINFALSKKSSDDTSFRTKEGLDSKVIRTLHPAKPAIYGYKGTGRSGERLWAVHKEHSKLLRNVFETYATDKFTLDEISDYAYSIGVRSTDIRSKTQRIGKNTWSHRLANQEYIGIFYHAHERFVGKYESIIDEDTYYQVQAVLNKNSQPRVNIDEQRTYAYSPKLIKCADCGNFMSGDHQKGITYYKCTKRKAPCKGTKKAYVPEDVFEKFLFPKFKNIELDTKRWKILREYIKDINNQDQGRLNKEVRKISIKISQEEKFILKTDKALISGEIDKESRIRLHENSIKKIEQYKLAQVSCENAIIKLNSTLINIIDDLRHVTKRLEIASPENKYELIRLFCSNLKWDGEKLRWNWKKPYFFLFNLERPFQNGRVFNIV